MKQNASGKGNKGLEIFELKKHMKNHQYDLSIGNIMHIIYTNMGT